MTSIARPVALGAIILIVVALSGMITWLIAGRTTSSHPGASAQRQPVEAARSESQKILRPLDELLEAIPSEQVPQANGLSQLMTDVVSAFVRADIDEVHIASLARGGEPDPEIVSMTRDHYRDYPPEYRPFDPEIEDDLEVLRHRMQEQRHPWKAIDERTLAFVYLPYATAPASDRILVGGDSDDLARFAGDRLAVRVGESKFSIRPSDLDGLLANGALPLAYLIAGVTIDDQLRTKAIIRITFAYHPSHGWVPFRISHRQSAGPIYAAPH